MCQCIISIIMLITVSIKINDNNIIINLFFLGGGGGGGGGVPMRPPVYNTGYNLFN